MVLYVIGLGLGGEKDITVRGLEAVRRSSRVILEHYGPVVGAEKDKLVRAVRHWYRLRGENMCNDMNWELVHDSEGVDLGAETTRGYAYYRRD